MSSTTSPSVTAEMAGIEPALTSPRFMPVRSLHIPCITSRELLAPLGERDSQRRARSESNRHIHVFSVALPPGQLRARAPREGVEPSWTVRKTVILPLDERGKQTHTRHPVRESNPLCLIESQASYQ